MPRPYELLLVEDSPHDVRLLREALTHATTPISLQVAGDGLAALQLLRRAGAFATARHPDLVLLDLNLPRLDGHQVLAAMKGDPALRRIPVIVMSTSQEPADVQRAYDLHCNMYVRKPWDFSDLLSVVERIEQLWLRTTVLPST